MVLLHPPRALSFSPLWRRERRSGRGSGGLWRERRSGRGSGLWCREASGVGLASVGVLVEF